MSTTENQILKDSSQPSSHPPHPPSHTLVPPTTTQNQTFNAMDVSSSAASTTGKKLLIARKEPELASRVIRLEESGDFSIGSVSNNAFSRKTSEAPYDRASTAHHRMPKVTNRDGLDECQIWIGNLNYDVNAEELGEFMLRGSIYALIIHGAN